MVGANEHVGGELTNASVLSLSSSALYSPFVTTSAEALSALQHGSIRRIADDAPLSPQEELANLYSRISTYFTHGEAKASNPFGIGRLERRHVEVIGVDVIGKESHTLAQAAVEDTAGLLGSTELLRSTSYGNAVVPPATLQRQLSALLDEPMPDLLAASCLSRSTINSVLRGAHEPDSGTVKALRIAMSLLDPDSRCPGIAGWRELLTPAHVAEVLGISNEDARLRFRGRVTWTEEERARLLICLIERDSDAATTSALDIRLLVRVPFFFVGPAEANMTNRAYMLKLQDAKEKMLVVRDQMHLLSDCPKDRLVCVGKQNYRYTLELVPPQRRCASTRFFIRRGCHTRDNAGRPLLSPHDIYLLLCASERIVSFFCCICSRLAVAPVTAGITRLNTTMAAIVRPNTYAALRLM